PRPDATPGARLVVAAPGPAAPAWSPGGDTLIYPSFRAEDGAAELRSVVVESGRETTLSAPGEDVFPFRASWRRPDEVVYTADGRIRTRSVTGREPGEIPFSATLTLDRGFYPRRRRDFDASDPRPVLGIRSPAVSPDGRRVLFVALGDLWIRERDGELTRLTDDPFVEAHPRWSPDGSTIAYVSDRDGPLELRLRDLASGEDRRVPGVAGAAYPAFSPDGTALAFFGSEGQSLLAARLRVLDLASGEIRTPLEPQVPATEISWAGPDEVALTVLAPDSTRFREGAYELLVVPVDGGSPRRLSFARPDSLAHASFSPDGRRIAYVADGVLSIAEVGDEGGITTDGEPRVGELADWPTWSGDGRNLVYLANGELRSLALDTGQVTTLPLHLTWVPQRHTGRRVVHAGRLFDGRSPGYRTNVDVEIVDGRIRGVTPHSAAAHGGDWVDASDRVVIPGLIEMHAHQGVAPESQGRAWLAFGVTSVRGPGEDAYDALERKESWAAGRRIGPRQFFAGRLFDGRRVYYTIAEGTDSLAHVAGALERAQRLGYDMIKTYVRLPDETQRRVAATAHDLGIPVSSHEIYPAAGIGVDAVEHLGGTSRRGYSPKITALGRSYDDVVTLLAASGMNLTATAVLPCYFHQVGEHPELLDNRQYRTFYGAGGSARLPPNLGAGALGDRCAAMGRTISRVVEAGGRVTAGTDSPFVPYGFGLHVELQLFERAGLEPWQVLRSATAWSAEAIGVGDDLGTLEAGKLADLVILDGDPLARIADTLRVTATMKGGRLYAIEDLLTDPLR
ncbi:MAG: amidohydrolase family protein, partial [Thermoanaerobaculia bacterium]|nr:amidohydrolase family protein [Thermoanaerobaculia bacterium]